MVYIFIHLLFILIFKKEKQSAIIVKALNYNALILELKKK